jgi:ATP-dependent DNA helicase RecG
MAKGPKQLTFQFDVLTEKNPQLLTPREIWVKLTEATLKSFLEDKRLERKSWQNIHFDKLAEYYSMSSNTVDGGVLVIGVENNGDITGCSRLSQKQINNIDSFHRTRCPGAKPEPKRVPIKGDADFVLAIFLPYVGKLVETNKGDAFIRYGESKTRMTDEEKRDFRATRQERSFELEHANLKYPEDFNTKIIDEICDRVRIVEKDRFGSWGNEEILEERMLGERKGNRFLPFNALVLLAGRKPAFVIPGCRIRIQRFLGTEEGEGASYNPIRDRYVEGNIVSMLSQAKPIIAELNYDVTWLNSDGKFVTTPEYPENAWLEAVTNACIHRSYSFSGSEITVKFFADRLEIESPGGFVPPVNERNIYDVRASRNPILCDALRYLGYVKMAREGARRMRASMQEWNLPDPTFRQEAIHGVGVRVVLRNDHENRKRSSERDVAHFFGVDVWRTLNEHEIKILAYAFRNKIIQVAEAQRLTGRTWHTSKKDLDRLVKRNLLEYMAGQYARDPKAAYRLKQSGTKNDE